MAESILPQDTDARLAALARLEAFIQQRLDDRAAQPIDAMGDDAPIGLSELINVLIGVVWSGSINYQKSEKNFDLYAYVTGSTLRLRAGEVSEDIATENLQASIEPTASPEMIEAGAKILRESGCLVSEACPDALLAAEMFAEMILAKTKSK